VRPECARLLLPEDSNTFGGPPKRPSILFSRRSLDDLKSNDADFAAPHNSFNPTRDGMPLSMPPCGTDCLPARGRANSAVRRFCVTVLQVLCYDRCKNGFPLVYRGCVVLPCRHDQGRRESSVYSPGRGVHYSRRQRRQEEGRGLIPRLSSLVIYCESGAAGGFRTQRRRRRHVPARQAVGQLSRLRANHLCREEAYRGAD